MDKKIFLVTMDTKHNGTSSKTTYSGLFIQSSDPHARKKLNETEKMVCEILEGEDNWIRCGCVTGYVESIFSNEEQALLTEHGLNKRFEF